MPSHSPIEGRDGGGPCRADATVALSRHHDPRRFPRTVATGTVTSTGAAGVSVLVDSFPRLYVGVFLVCGEGPDG